MIFERASRPVQMIICAVLLGLCFLSSPVKAASEPKVIASIKPLHSLVAAVMGQTGTPALLVGGLHSPHDYQLKPSQVEMLHHADIVFYIGSGMESFLVRPLADLPSSVRQDAMIGAPGVTVLAPRTGGEWEPDEDAPKPPPGVPPQDQHVWLEIGNAKAMVSEIVKQLSALYPQNKAIYEKNAATLDARLDTLNIHLRAELAPVAGRPYIVFHDAFHYFERDYGLTAVGSITLEPEQEPGAKRINEIRAKVRTAHIRCVFAEPQFNSRVVQTVTEGSQAKTGIIDENGADIPDGPDLYPTLLQKTADRFISCLE